MRALIIALPIYALAQCVYAEPELKGSPEELIGFLHPKKNIVSISDTATKRSYSDEAIISLIVTTESKLLSDALKQNESVRSKLLNQLLASGLSTQQIQNSKFSSNPQYGWFGKTPESHKVVNRISITIHKEKQLQNIATTADTMKQVELKGIEFKNTKEEALKTELKDVALAKIMKSKAQYEQSLNLKLKARGFRELYNDAQATMGANALEETLHLRENENSRTSFISKSYEAPAQSSGFDEMNYRVALTVDFIVAE